MKDWVWFLLFGLLFAAVVMAFVTIFVFKKTKNNNGPAGPQGPAGANGPQGSAGPQGTAGGGDPTLTPVSLGTFVATPVKVSPPDMVFSPSAFGIKYEVFSQRIGPTSLRRCVVLNSSQLRVTPLTVNQVSYQDVIFRFDIPINIAGPTLHVGVDDFIGTGTPPGSGGGGPHMILQQPTVQISGTTPGSVTIELHYSTAGVDMALNRVFQLQFQLNFFYDITG